MTEAQMVPAGFPTLLSQFPWPVDQPVPDAPPAGRKPRGLDLLFGRIDERDAPVVVMEIGAEFGGSTRRFLERSDTWVVSVDPWPDVYGSRVFPQLQPFLGHEQSMYDLFQSFCWAHRDRLVAVRGFSPEGVMVVHGADVSVDVVYIDGDHRYDAVVRDLTVASALFPQAILAGDDWLFSPTAPKYEGMTYPVQAAVKSWASFHDVAVSAEDNTWIVDKDKPYNMDPPAPRFADGSSAKVLTEIDRRLRRVERAVTQPSLARRLERRVRSIHRS